MREYYILNNDHVVTPVTYPEWDDWNVKDRIIMQHELSDGAWISTMFFGINDGDGPPLLFETMIFKDRRSCKEIHRQKHSTYEEAVLRHQELIMLYETGELGMGLTT